MSTTFFDIEVIFQVALNAISSKPYIDFEGQKPYKPVIGTRYWRTTHQPAVSNQITVDGIKRHVGNYQIDVICPTNAGLRQMKLDYDTIATKFDVITPFTANNTKLQISGVTQGRVVREDSWLFGFIRVSYVCYSI